MSQGPVVLPLVIIMIATTLTAASGEAAGAIMPLVVGIIAVTIARGRWTRLQHAA